MHDITVCTVNFNLSEILKVQLDHLARVNQDAQIQVIVVQNTPFQHSVSYPHVEMRVLDGIPMHLAKRTAKNLGDPSKIGQPKGGNQHGMALNKAIDLVTTRYMVILDPDCFIFTPFSSLIQDMQEENLSFMSTTYGHNNTHTDPARFNQPKMSSAPSPFFTLIDLEKWKESLSWDPRDWEDQFIIDQIETGMVMRTKAYKYKHHIFNICTHKNCSICKDLNMPFDSIAGKSAIVEKFFWRNSLVCCHLHYRDANMDPVRKIVDAYEAKPIHHSQSTYIKFT